MNIGDFIKKTCAEKKIPVSKLEKDCGFANGYISKLKSNKIPADRLYKIAEYLDVDPDAMMNHGLVIEITEEGLESYDEYYDKKRTAEMAQAFKDNPELRLLFDVAKDSEPEDINTIYQVLLALKRKERR